MPVGEITRDSKAREKWSVRPRINSDFQNRLANKMIPTQNGYSGEIVIDVALHKLVHESGKVFTEETKDKLEKDGFIFYRLRKDLVSEVAFKKVERYWN